MLQDINVQGARHDAGAASDTRDVSLEAILSAMVAVAVFITAYINWHAGSAAQRPFNLLGLVIHCLLVGILGLLVATLIEQRFAR